MGLLVNPVRFNAQVFCKALYVQDGIILTLTIQQEPYGLYHFLGYLPDKLLSVYVKFCLQPLSLPIIPKENSDFPFGSHPPFRSLNQASLAVNVIFVFGQYHYPSPF